MILGTAGHIDHGKTTLVKALTGVDTDRLPEEKRRGITIELGFAPLALDGVGTIGIVDVPGHEAFVRTMLAGATGIDLALVVIAADEGIMPQSREHLAILELLGVSAGVVAITKSDLADSDWMKLVEDDVRAALANGPLRGAAIVRCSAATGAGLDALRDALRAAALAVPARSGGDYFRMPVDRAFSVKGTGTVVTGTIWSGRVAADAHVTLAPGARDARVRGIEAHGMKVAEATTGSRAAIALAGVDREEVSPRGTWLVQAGDPWKESRLVRADVALLDDAPTLGPRSKVRFHLGTAEVGARLVAVGAPVKPGTRVPVRVALDAPIVARAGDRFVIRSTSPTATIGGGVITDPAPVGRRIRPFAEAGASAATRLAWLVTEAGGRGVEISSLALRLGVGPGELPGVIDSRVAREVSGRLYHAALISDAAVEVAKLAAKWNREHPLDSGMPMQAMRDAVALASDAVDEAVRIAVAKGKVVASDGVLAAPGWKPGSAEEHDRRTSAILKELDAAGAQPPTVDELAVRHGRETISLLRLLTKAGALVQLASDRFMTSEAREKLVAQVQAALADGKALTASELREITGLTRKYLIPFLEYCDRERITVRKGDLRVLP